MEDRLVPSDICDLFVTLGLWVSHRLCLKTFRCFKCNCGAQECNTTLCFKGDAFPFEWCLTHGKFHADMFEERTSK